MIYSISNGGVIKISCEAQGDPKPTIRWEVDGNRVTEEVSSGKPAGEFHFLVSENESLTIINSQSSKRDGPVNVTCIANSTAGIAQRTFQVIFVKGWFYFI